MGEVAVCALGRGVGESLVNTGVAMTQIQLHHLSPPQRRVTVYKHWKLEAHCTTCWKLNRLQGILC